MKKFAYGLVGVALTAATIVTAGCGSTAPFPTTPIAGKVAYEDGTPIPAARLEVKFVPQVAPKGPKENPRPAFADVKADGTFSQATTWKYGDGAIVGPHKVLIKALDDHQRTTKAVSSDYSNVDKSPLTVDVTPGGGPYDLKVKKP